MSNLKEVPLPTGGRAWVRKRLSHDRDGVFRAIFAGMATLLGRARALSGLGDAETTAETATEVRSITSTVNDSKREIVELCTHRWEGVRDPDNDDVELVFPADVGKLDREDFEALFDGILEALREGRADPKGSPAPSSVTS